MEFEVSDRVMLKVSPWKGVVRFGKRGKLNLKYVGPFKVLAKVGKYAYKLELPQELCRVHHTFHVSNLKKCYSDEPLVMPSEGVHIDDTLQFVEESVKIMEREIKRLKRSRIPLVKEKMQSCRPQFLEAYSYEASHIDNFIPQKEKDPMSFTLPCYINNVCFDNALADLGASVSLMTLSTYLNLDFIILGMPEDVKVPLILERSFLSTTYAKIDVLKRKITLRVEDEKITFKSVKPTIELRRDQVDDLMPTIEEGKDKLEYKGNNVVGYLMNIPIFVETFSVLADFTILEDMDAYHDEGMGDVIFGKPFFSEVGINARQFKGMITIYNVQTSSAGAFQQLSSGNTSSLLVAKYSSSGIFIAGSRNDLSILFPTILP
nr:putative reverse transcriptase domain-containing protein [Tanacetum cinerariifolium]